jgi:hypothetical protein
MVDCLLNALFTVNVRLRVCLSYFIAFYALRLGLKLILVAIIPIDLRETSENVTFSVIITN